MDRSPASAAAAALERRLESELSALDAQAQLRRLEILPESNFCSNDYLGLSRDPRLRQAVADALAAGAAVCSTGSRLLSGNAEMWEELEAELADFIGAPAALYFSSGYAANIGLLSSLAGPQDTIFSDAANHASIIDGIRLSGARKVIFPHLDLEYLEKELRNFSSGHTSPDGTTQRFIVVESVFSMDGDRAPLGDLLALGERWGAELIVDEAHATGASGAEGRGLAAEYGGIFATVHPCGKALAGMGAFVCGSGTLKQYLINRARTFIFSTALPPYFAAQMRAAIRIVTSADAERRRLADLSAHLRRRLGEAGFDTGRSDSQIVPVLLGDNQRAVHYAARLGEAGFAVRAIRPPTVPAGTARLRISLNAGMSVELMDALADALARIREQEPASALAAR